MAANEAKLSGKIIRAQTVDEGVPDATVRVADRAATTNASGDYELIVPRNAPYRMAVSAEGYYKLIEQEVILEKDVLNQGFTNLLPSVSANLVAGFFPGRSADKGLVVVKVSAEAPCASEEGSTITIDPPGDAKRIYFAGSLPDSQQAAVKAGSTFSAAFYNVEVGVPLKLRVESPRCKELAFPVDVGDVTYTGGLTAEAGEALSYMRLFLKEGLSDAGENQ